MFPRQPNVQLPNPHLARLTSAPSVNRGSLPKRRSSRIALKTPIGLAGEDRLKCAFTMPATATNLNRHGATVQVTRELSVGSTVTVRNKRGSIVSARVVAQVSAFNGLRSYGIEFLERDDKAQNFWGISFPTALVTDPC